MPLSEELDINEFVRIVLEDNRSVITGLGLDPLQKSDSNERLPDEYQFYVQKVGFCLANTLRWCKQLELSVELMGNFDYKKTPKVSRADHFVYSIENYIIRLNSIYDRVLQLINAVFHIGMNEENVSHGPVISNDKLVHRSEIRAAIKHVQKCIEPHAQTRHALIHKHAIMEKDLSRIELFYLHDVNQLSSDEAWRQNFKIARAQYLRRFSARKRREFVSLNQELVRRIDELFSQLKDEYIRQKMRIHKDIY